MKKKSTTSKYKSFNVNQNIRVRLTDLGYQRLEDASAYLSSRVPNLKKLDVKYFKGQADKNGYSTFQMWDFMHTFGEVSGLCMPQYYHLDILIDDNDLSNYKQPRKKS